MDDLISREKAIDLFPNDDLEGDTKGGYIAPHLARQMISELPSVQPETHDKRTKTHSCDCISRQAAIEELQEHRNLFCDNTPETFSKLSYAEKSRVDELDMAIATLINLLSAQPDTEAEIQKMQDLEQAQMDKAYELGYEEGKVSAQPETIRCKDCKHHDGIRCFRWNSTIITKFDDFCSRAERRTDEPD